MEEIPLKFKFFIEKLLRYSGLIKPEQLKLFTDNYCLHEFLRAFTSAEISEDFNYEYYEEMGDTAVNKIVVWYLYRRLKLGSNKSIAVKVISRLKNTYATTIPEAQMSKKLGFWEFIRTTEDEKTRNEQGILEDIFESFVGCLEFLVDTRILKGVGYSVVYTL